MKGYAVGTGNFHSEVIKMIADTGSSINRLPEKVAEEYYANISNAAYSSRGGTYIFPCNADLPSITFDIGSYHAVIPGSFMKYAPVPGSNISEYHQFRAMQ